MADKREWWLVIAIGAVGARPSLAFDSQEEALQCAKEFPHGYLTEPVHVREIGDTISKKPRILAASAGSAAYCKELP